MTHYRQPMILETLTTTQARTFLERQETEIQHIPKKLTSCPTQPQLTRHIHIPLPIHPGHPLPRLIATDPHHLLLIPLPGRPAIDAPDLFTGLRFRPLLETLGMDVIPARGAAEDDLLLVGCESREADGAIPLDGLAIR